MKTFLITYRLKPGADESRWHQDVAAFIAAVDGDPELKGSLSYRCMKRRGGSEYYHLARAADDRTVETLQSRDFFTRYTGLTEGVADGEVEVTPLEIVAETASAP